LASEIEELETEVYERFDGWTFRGDVTGAYRMADGTRSTDKSGAYEVVLEDSRIPELEQLLRDFKGKTLQESIYLEIQRNLDVRFIQ
jgi:hypothetical protein